jgi:hypothetical protein
MAWQSECIWGFAKISDPKISPTKRRRAQRRLESLLPQSPHPTFYFRIHVCEGLRNRTLLGLRTRSLLLFRPKRGDPVANSHDPTTTTPLCPALPSQHKGTFPLPPRSQLPFSEYEQHFFLERPWCIQTTRNAFADSNAYQIPPGVQRYHVDQH